MVSIHTYPRLICSLICALFSLTGMAQNPAGQPSSPTETNQFLARFAAARKQAGDTQVSFREKRFLPFMEHPMETTGTLAFHPPNCFRRKVDRGSLTVSNGKTLWIYNPALQQVEIYDLTQTQFLGNALMAMTAALSASQLPQLFHCTLYRSSNKTVTLRLVPRGGALRKVAPQITLVLASDFSPSQLEILSPQRDRTLTTFGEETRVRLTPKTFEFRPPPGTQISRPLVK